MTDISDIDAAWLAGLLEGEGSFNLRTKRGYRGSISIGLQMTDEDTVRRAGTLMDAKMYGPYGPYGKSKLPTWQVVVFAKQAEAIMRRVLPWMGARRTAKINELLAHRAAGQIVDPTRKPSCHPDRKYSAKGLCKLCYCKEYHARVAA